MTRLTPKFVLAVSGLLFVFFLLLEMQDFEEAEVDGWTRNTTRNLEDYLDKEKMTATILPDNLCSYPSLLVIMVTTAPHKLDNRMAIRETWGKEKRILGHNVSIYYLIGQTDDENIQEWISWEAAMYDDIIQDSFKDSYNNLTIKSAVLLKNFILACSENSDYVLKIDDDIFLGLPRLVAQLASRNESVGRDLLMGGVICGAEPIRNTRDKWYTPTYLFAETKYPRYTSGTAYLMASETAVKIFNAALKTPIFHLEDVYLTGICSRKAGISPTHNPLFTYRYANFDNDCLYVRLITVHYQTPESIRRIFNATSDPNFEEMCLRRENAFQVRKWMIQNVFMIGKDRRRIRCS